MSPRSILKQSSYSRPEAPSLAAALPYPPPTPQVHFPPTPALTQTQYTHSRTAYDRAPIVVLPNDCALPERGCPGRTYDCRSLKSSPRSPGTSSSMSGKHLHVRAFEANSDGRISYFDCPSVPAPVPYGPPGLIPDISSESDESDGIVSPPPEYNNAGGAGAASQAYSRAVHIATPSQEELNKHLAFLPHAPSSPPKKDSQKRDKERKRRGETPRFKSEDGARSFAASSLDGCLGGF
ncbi:uncharacterized protein FOMMEDRAFT_18935 [Fomitiporia mediterranea MF3/22]|uniref:uncharacterized protein n=1 Tax=Fomitiporia mediterranea (strain MF3/22) TaxID=694068 RepID=UPI00044083E3|nr:uncharacterized protein FOMMEDRAFT_18935 [Fomitiporia mediterranea MF3/22]EJD03553.1 hypothetical protein FOMMEDRAFT_18935 [Fomitiporia mediterranea MF3/22]